MTEQAAPRQSYDPHYFGLLFEVEDRHFWFRGRNRIIAGVVREITRSFPPGYRVLEVGCGTGNVLRTLEQVCSGGEVIGLDAFPEALEFARRRTSCRLIQGDVTRLNLNMEFELIGLFDVLEHLEDDVQALEALRGLLAANGALLVTVPAHPYLWSYFDKASRHQRRYELSELECKLTNAGYRIDYLTQYMVSVFPVVWLGRRLATAGRRRETAREEDLVRTELRIVPIVNSLMTWFLSQEARLIVRRRRLPIGTSLLAIARRS